MTDEQRLLESLRRGEPTAFEQLVRQTSARVLAVARRMLRSEEDARDVVQETYLQAFRALDAFAGEARLSTWLHRIAVNAALMRLRARRRRPESSIEEMLPRFLQDGHRESPAGAWRSLPDGADAALDRKQLQEIVRRSIDSLPDTHRNVLLLRDIEELDTKETAEILGITPNAVKIRLHRARQALRELLDPHFREEPIP